MVYNRQKMLWEISVCAQLVGIPNGQEFGVVLVVQYIVAVAVAVIVPDVENHFILMDMK